MRYAAILILALAGWAGAQPVIPDTRAGTVLQAWLDAFNSGDRARVTAYLSKYEPREKDRIDGTLEFRERTGGFAITQIEKSEPLHIEALAKEREGRGNVVRIALDVDDSETPTVQNFAIRIVPPKPDKPEARLGLTEAIRALDAQAIELTGKDQFSGAVLIARGPKTVFEKAYGLADREKHIAATSETRFRIGSMNKLFTATAVLQLVGQGKIDLAAPLGRYLTDYPNKDVATKVTIRHLLTHTGGTGDIFTPEFEQHRLEMHDLSDYLKLYGSRGLEFEPGTKWSYSNYGFILLGAVIEKVSGVSYYDYVRKHIFEPAGMHATDSLPETDKVNLRSVGYMRKGKSLMPNSDTLPWRGTSAGGGYSTVGDLFRFAQALSAGKLLKPELFAEMTSKQAAGRNMPPDAGYGFGMMVSEGPEGKRYGHGGGAPGMNGELRVFPRTSTVVVVLANLDPPVASELADFFEARMPVD
jgi:D-alanyl-D-alanine carboxypeptidase